MTNRAVDILNRHNPVDVNERVTQWRQTGWTGYDPNAEPYRSATEARDWSRSTGAGTDMGVDMSSDYPRSTSASMDTGRETGTEWPRTTGMTSSYNDFSYYDNNFRQHFDTSSLATDYTYDQFRPAYRYGYDLATDQTYYGRDWNDIEMDAQRRLEERNPGTWERFKDSVRHAWQEIKDTVS
jgi:hypothetical protein